MTAETFTFEVPFLDDHGKVVRRSVLSAERMVFDLGRAELEMVRVPAGELAMGSPGRTGYDDERPQHRVAVAAFRIGRYAVTQEQWGSVMSWSPPYRCKGARLPADRTSWIAANEFCKALTAKIGRAVSLPSEAQWEYACRAGTTTPFAYGPTLTTELANYVGLHTYALEPTGEYRHATVEVGSLPPNAFGLCEMHGNVWEWCEDRWHESYDGAPADGSAWTARAAGKSKEKDSRVLRGGCWHDPPDVCRSAARVRLGPEEPEDWAGFRVVMADE